MIITAAVLGRSELSRPYHVTRPLELREAELAPPRGGEALVAIRAAGLCHSDLSVINGDRPRPLPMVLGHEAAGVVLETGGESCGLKAGDHVVMVFLPACGECAQCAAGNGYMCEDAARANAEGRMLRGGRRLSAYGHDVNHHLGVSAFASHPVIDARSAIKIPEDIPFEIAAMFGCAVLTGVGAVLNTACVRPGESVAIFGLGGVGLAAVLGAAVSGAHPIIAIDPLKHKRDLALQIGASHAFAPEEAEVGISALTSGVDVSVETAGKAVALISAYRAARRGGRVVTAGLPNPKEQFAVAASTLTGEGKTLLGSYMGSSIPRRDIPRYIALWRAGKLPVEKLLSSVHPLEDINSLLDELSDGNALRQVIVPMPASGQAKR